MRLGIFAKTFAGSEPGPVLTAVARAGFSAAQYNMACSGLAPMPDAVSDTVVGQITTAARASGVELAALSATYNMIHPDPAVRRQGHARLEVLARIARKLPARLLTLCTGTRDPDDQWRAHADNATPEAWADLLTSMETAIAIADRHDVDLGIEPELANVVNSAAKARRLIDELGSPRVKIVLDPANLFETEPVAEQRRIVSEAIGLLADRVVMVHAKDRNAAGHFVTAGKGVLDYAHFFGALKSAGLDCPLVTHGLPAEDAPGVAGFLHDGLDRAGLAVAR